MRPSMGGDPFLKSFHFAQHFLAMFPAIRSVAFDCPLHAQRVHFAEECQWFPGRAVLQAVLTNEGVGFHQGAGDVGPQGEHAVFREAFQALGGGAPGVDSALGKS